MIPILPQSRQDMKNAKLSTVPLAGKVPEWWALNLYQSMVCPAHEHDDKQVSEGRAISYKINDAGLV